MSKQIQAFTEFDMCFSQAQTAFASGQYDITLDNCKKALKLNPKVAMVYALAGNTSLVLNDMKQAEAYFRDAVKLQPYVGERYFDLGNSLFGQQRLSEAMTYYATASQLGCSAEIMQKLYYLLGVINQLQGKNQEALVNYKKSQSLPGANADLEDILLKSLQIHIEEHNFVQAENCAKQLNNLIPNEFQSYQLLFQIYLEQRKTAEANNALEEARKYVNLNDMAKIELGFDEVMLSCFLAEQETENSTEYYNQALRQLDQLEDTLQLSDKDHCEVLITSAEIHMKLNNNAEAVRLAQQVTAQEDAALTEYVDRGWYILSKCAAEQHDYSELERYAHILKESDNLIHRHYGYYAEMYAVNKLAEKDSARKEHSEALYNQAIAYYKNCTVISPGDYIAYLYRAKAYVDRGKWEKVEDISHLLPKQTRQALEDYIRQVEVKADERS